MSFQQIMGNLVTPNGKKDKDAAGALGFRDSDEKIKLDNIVAKAQASY